MWHRFGQGFREVILRAVAQLDAGNERDLSTRHLLSALAAERDLPAAKILSQMGISPAAIEVASAQIKLGERPHEGQEQGLTPEARAAVERTYGLAAELDDEYVGGEHLLLALLIDPNASDAGCALAQLGVTWERAGQTLMMQQQWRTCAPQGIRVPGSRLRRLAGGARRKAGRARRVAYGLADYQKPFMPYLLFPGRTTDNPHPFYSRLRRRPFYWDAQIQQWVVTGYADVLAALAEPRLSHKTYTPSAWGREDLPPLVEREFRRLDSSISAQMIFQDAPEHLSRRSRVARLFTPRVIDRMKQQVQETTDALLDAIAAKGRTEVIADLALPLPLTVIARMVGVPEEDARQFKKWSADFNTYVGGEASLPQSLAAYHNLQELTAYFQHLIPLRLRDPQEDLLTLLLQADENGERLTEGEVITNCLLLLAAGHENTTRIIGIGLLALLRCPEQMGWLRENPALIAPAVEEILRYDGPVQWTLRVTREAFEWRGHSFQKGQMVRLGLAAANRDSTQFPNPDQLDITRAENRHVAFGNGPHFCLGAALTRMEAQIVLGALIARFPRMRLASEPEWCRGNFTFRGLQTLQIRVD